MLAKCSENSKEFLVSAYKKISKILWKQSQQIMIENLKKWFANYIFLQGILFGVTNIYNHKKIFQYNMKN